jgi:hypothetical protein
MYFSNFPGTLFQISPAKFGEPARFASLVDITKNVRFKKEVIDNIVLYDWYMIKEGDSIETTSEKLYGSPHYHWVLMLLNDMYDWRTDFPLETFQFDDYMIDKYGSIETAKSTVSFYRNSQGFVVDSDHIGLAGIVDAEAVFAYDHELAINDSKRRIKIISKELLATVLENFRRLI